MLTCRGEAIGQDSKYVPKRMPSQDKHKDRIQDSAVIWQAYGGNSRGDTGAVLEQASLPTLFEYQQT